MQLPLLPEPFTVGAEGTLWSGRGTPPSSTAFISSQPLPGRSAFFFSKINLAVANF